MKRFNLWAGLAAAVALLSAAPAMADNYPVKDASGTTQTFCSKLVGGLQYPCHLFVGMFASTPTPVSVDVSGNVNTNVVSSALPTGAATSSAQTTGNGSLATIATNTTGAATAAAQATGNASLGTIATNTAGLATAAAQTTANNALTSVIGAKAPGTAAASSQLAGGVYNSGGVTLTTTQQTALQVDSAGNLKVTGGGGGQQWAEDSVHTTGDLGTLSLSVRKDTAVALAGSDGDYAVLETDGSGRLWANIGASVLPTGAATSALQGAQGTGSQYNPPTGGSGEIGYLSAIYAASQDVVTAQPVKIDHTTPGTTDGVVATLKAAATGGCTPYGLASAASTNATNVKASAGTLCSLSLTNTTATLEYFRLYNLASAPTCSSATGYVLTVAIPANTAGAGIVVNTGPFGWAFSAGVGFCITGGPTATDNTNAATGVGVVASYQ